MKIHITSDQPLKVRQATQFLGVVTLVDAALNLTQESAENLVERLNNLIPERSLGDELQKLGRDFLKPYYEFDPNGIDPLLMDLVVQAHVNTCSADDDLELVALSEGSIRGQFREKLAGIGEKLRKLLSAMKHLLPSENTNEFNAILAQTLSDNELQESAQATLSGTVAIAAVSASLLLQETGATNLEVKADEDDETGQLVPLMAH